MQYSSEFMQLRLKSDHEGPGDINVTRLALASLQRKPDDEELSDFEARQLASFELFKAQAALLEKAAEQSDLFPRLTNPPKIAHGIAEFEQTFEGTTDPGRLSGRDLAHVAKTIGDGLSVFHKAGGVHLGIHPSALSFRFGGQPLLYGIGAQMRDVAAKSDGFSALGDPEFFPPELFDKSGKSKVGPWTDIYQLCATLYALFLGAPPPSFVARLKDDKTSLDLIQSRLRQDAQMKQSGLADAIVTGLQLSRNQRPQLIEDWLALFEHSAFESPTPDRPSATAGLAAEGRLEPEPGLTDAADFAALSTADDVLADHVLAHEEEFEAEEAFEEPSGSGGFGFGKAFLLVLFAGVIFAGGFYANTFLMPPGSLPQKGGEGVVEPIEEEPVVEEPPEEEIIEEEPFAAAWLVGDWVIDQAENGCEARLIIQEGDAEDELRFINPDEDITGKDTFVTLSPNSIETSSWTYTLDGDTISVVGVTDATQTLMLSQCAEGEGTTEAAEEAAE